MTRKKFTDNPKYLPLNNSFFRLQRSRPVTNAAKPLNTARPPADPAQGPESEEISPLDQQIAWEESHLGNFRKIMPPPDPSRLTYYLRFYRQSNQVSIFQETAASKKREDLARKMRLQIEEKRAKQEQMMITNAKRKRPVLPRNVRERHRHFTYRLKENWTPGFVSDAEERLRNTWQQMRTEAIKNLKITETVS